MLYLLYMFCWELPKRFYIILLRPQKQIQMEDIVKRAIVVLLAAIGWKIFGPIGAIAILWIFPYLFALAVFLWAYVFFGKLPTDL